MTIRLAASPEQIAAVDTALTVREAARRLGCDPSTVRKLIKAGALTGHRVGCGAKRKGVRVSAASLDEYRARNAIAGTPAAAAPQRAKPANQARLRESLAALRNLGVPC